MTAVLQRARRRPDAKVSSIGTMAAGDLARTGTWRLVSVHERCFYYGDEQGNLICIGQQSVGRGPFTLTFGDQSGWPHAALRAIAGPLCVQPDRLVLSSTGFSLDLSGALLYQERLEGIVGTGDCDAKLGWLAERARNDSPGTSLGRLIPGLVSGMWPEQIESPDLIMQTLQRHIAELARKARLTRRLPIEELVALIGCGCGLTPSGDDFLAGILLGQGMLKQTSEARLLAARLYRQAQGRTTAISLAFYRALAAGWLSETQKQAVALFCPGTAGATELSQVTRFGATSGWDLLAGMVFVLSSAAAFSGGPERAEQRAAMMHH